MSFKVGDEVKVTEEAKEDYRSAEEMDEVLFADDCESVEFEEFMDHDKVMTIVEIDTDNTVYCNDGYWYAADWLKPARDIIFKECL